MYIHPLIFSGHHALSSYTVFCVINIFGEEDCSSDGFEEHMQSDDIQEESNFVKSSRTLCREHLSS